MAGEPVVIGPDFQARALADVGTLGQPVHAGAPRSPNERATVQATKLGALVHTSGWQLWRPADLDGPLAYADLRYCTVANDRPQRRVCTRRQSHRHAGDRAAVARERDERVSGG